MAEYLIRHGADIKKPNQSGQTCLMKAVKFKELSQLLIDNGADVMARDEFGCLALHYAIKEDRPDTVQLLLVDHGSDPYLKNNAGDDAFRTASLEGQKLILKELLFKLKPPVQYWIESYQLLGGYYVDFGNDIVMGMNFWKDAVDVQQKNSGVAIISSKPNPVYLFALEVNTVEELEALARNRESVHMYALMIRERILGPNHDDTHLALLNRGKSYKRNGETRRCMDIWKHAIQLQSSHVGQLTDRYLHNFLSLCSLFYNSHEMGRQSNRSVDQHILIDDSFEVLEMVTMKLELNKPAEKNFKTKSVPSNFMDWILIIMEFITEQDTNANRECSLRNIVHRLVRCQPMTDQGRTLLHLSILPSTYFSDNRGSISQFTDFVVV